MKTDLICRVHEVELGEEEHPADFFYGVDCKLYPICKFHYDVWIVGLRDINLIPEVVMISFDKGWDLWNCQCVLEV